MFSHVMIGTNDLDRSKKFYDALFQAIGGEPGHVDARGRLIYAKDSGRLLLSKPIDGAPATGANGGTVGFSAGSAEQVHAWHEAGVANGGKPVEDPPGVRNKTMYMAYLRDPDGNKICVLHRMAS